MAELEVEFGVLVADCVSALTKNKALPKENRMSDCLARIKKLPKEAWAVKLADRITNLQRPPKHWSNEKRTAYLDEARVIYAELRDGNDFLAGRLNSKMDEYCAYLSDEISY